MFLIILFGFLAVFFACLSQKRKVPVIDACDRVTVYKYKDFSFVYFAISFLLLAVPCFFCAEGTDMPIYVQLYNNWTLADLTDLSFESGFMLLCMFLRLFFGNAYIGLGIIKLVSIFLVYKSLYILKDRLNLGFSVLSYVVLLYIFSFHLLRMSLALGMIFLALTYELTGKSKRAVLLIIFAFLFHYSSVIVLMTFCIYKILGKKLTVAKITVLSLVLILLYGNIVPILQYIVPAIKFFNKYKTYLNNANSYIGIVQIVLFIPIAYILINLYRKGIQDKFYILNTILGIMLFFAGTLGYLLPVISRTVYYFFFCVLTLFASTPLVKDKCVFVLGKVRINSVTLLAFLYLIMQVAIMYVLNNSFVSNGLTQYTLWLNK